MKSKRKTADLIWLPAFQTAEGADFLLPNGDKGYFYCTSGGWVLYVNGKCLFEGYQLGDILGWLTMLGARRVKAGVNR